MIQEDYGSMKKIALCIVGIYSFTLLSAQNPTDSLRIERKDSLPASVTNNFGRRLDRFSSSRFYRMTYIGVPLVVGGLIVKSEDDHFRSLRNDYLPRFNRRADDYLQYAPAAVMLGLKAFGVKGRSSWGRMIVSDVFSALLMGGAVNTMKQTTHVVRPDGSNDRSFPSGHTATAFMTATMLTKEYGHKSPCIGIGAYTAASATGLMRMANNKHWLSDVLTGAGIEQTEFRTSSGSSAGVEGAYFFNPYIGVGGRFAVSNTSIIVNNDAAEDNTFDAMSLCGGAYFSYPLSARWLVGSKLMGGYVHYPSLKLSEQTVPAKNGVCFGSGFSVTFKAKEHLGVRFFLDYNLMPSHSAGSSEWMNTLTCGASIAVTL